MYSGGVVDDRISRARIVYFVTISPSGSEDVSTRKADSKIPFVVVLEWVSEVEWL